MVITMADIPRLIEHAFPFKQASLDSVHEKNVLHGHISTLHIWPERRTLTTWRADKGFTKLSANEWANDCSMRQSYWIYSVYNCATPNPRFVRVQDPFGKVIMNVRSGVSVNAREILAAGEE